MGEMKRSGRAPAEPLMDFVSIVQLGSPSLNELHIDSQSPSTSMLFVSAPSSPRNSTAGSRVLFSNTSLNPKLNGLKAKSLSLTEIENVVFHLRDEGHVKSYRNGTQGANEIRELAYDPVSYSVTSSDFDFSTFSEFDGQPLSPTVMSSADELFYNGQIRPLQSLQDKFRAVKQMGTTESDNGSLFDFRNSAIYIDSGTHSPELSLRQDRSFKSVKAWEEFNNRNKHVTKTGGEMQLLTANRLETRDRGQGRSPPRSVDELEQRGREGRIRYRRGGKITRSLSPLRVFQWDDQPARASYEGENFSWMNLSKNGNDNSKEQALKMNQSGGWTLKELLGYIGDGKAANKQSPAKLLQRTSKRMDRISFMKGKSSEATAVIAAPKQSPKHHDQQKQHKDKHRKNRSGGAAVITLPQKQHQKHYHHREQRRRRNGLGSPKGSLSPHELHYAMYTQQAQQMKKRTFLPYRQGLLGCLGFSFFPESFS